MIVFGNRVFADAISYDEIILDRLGWVLNSVTGVLIKRPHCDTQTEKAKWRQAEIGVTKTQAKECWRLPAPGK